MKYSTLRKITIAIFVFSCFAALAFHAGTGTLSSFGWDAIAYICPLGSIEAMLASWTLLPRPIIVLALLLVFAFFFGKVFCAWACPIPPLKNFFSKKEKHPSRSHQKTVQEGISAEVVAVETLSEEAGGKNDEAQDAGCSSAHGCASCSSCGEKRKKLDSRHIVLGGSLLSAVAFGFPVFCLICPVGLVFASIIVWWRFFGFAELTITLIVFPVILLFEILVIRKWCLKFCPLGAVMSLLALPNRFFRPRVDGDKCLRGQGVECNRCEIVCKEELDPHVSSGMHECSKCGQCIEACPAQAISMKFLPPSKP